MEFQARIVPTRAMLERMPLEGAQVSDAAGIEMMLNLFATADKVRACWYGPLQQQEDISEGKFSLLMALYGEGPLLASKLAARMGVKPATASIMVKRMLAAPHPLVAITVGETDRRERFVTLTEAGRSLLERLLPEHFAILRRFTTKLSTQERETFITLLKKLRQD